MQEEIQNESVWRYKETPEGPTEAMLEVGIGFTIRVFPSSEQRAPWGNIPELVRRLEKLDLVAFRDLVHRGQLIRADYNKPVRLDA